MGVAPHLLLGSETGVYGRMTNAVLPSSFFDPMGARVRMQDATGRPATCSGESNARRRDTVLWLTWSFCVTFSAFHDCGSSAEGAPVSACATMLCIGWL